MSRRSRAMLFGVAGLIPLGVLGLRRDLAAGRAVTLPGAVLDVGMMVVGGLVWGVLTESVRTRGRQPKPRPDTVDARARLRREGLIALGLWWIGCLGVGIWSATVHPHPRWWPWLVAPLLLGSALMVTALARGRRPQSN